MSNGTALLVWRWQLAGSAVATLGLMTLAAGTGLQLGRRRVQPREQSQSLAENGRPRRPATRGGEAASASARSAMRSPRVLSG